MAVSAPGDTYLALFAAGRLEHPFRGRGEGAAEWVRHREWWWHSRIDGRNAADGERLDLVFEGLDTFADIFLNGAKIGSSDNMFRTLRLDVTDAIGAGEHDLAIRFHPTAAVIGDRQAPEWKLLNVFNQEKRALMRKAQFGWGWDWGRNLPTVGIWQPVRIESSRGVTVASLNFATLSIETDAATVKVDVETTGAANVEIELADPDGVVVATSACEGSGSVTFQIANPRLWWTADLGAQPLYSLTARVAGAPDFQRRVGIRTIAIDESPDPDEPGTTFFRFVLNGVPIFAKGACWIPASSFIGAVPSETYQDLVTRAVDANMNMMRVWGGGIYEPDIFYDACDAQGLLVWQDFMFACAPYPDDADFIANVRGELAKQIRRLRGHACLAVWCGNNENQILQSFDNYMNKTDDSLPGLSIFDEHMPDLLRELDPSTPYRPSSPWGGPSPNSMRGGDVHNWTVWHGAAPVPDKDPVGPLMAKGPEGIAYTRYAEDKARFVSEFGIHGSPALETLQRWLAPEDLHLDSQGFRDRIKDGGDKANKMASLVTGRATDLGEYVDFTMLTQAEGLTFGIEHYRRRKPHCSGTLIWQYNDCWPCVSWSLIDYDGIAKAGYFAVKRVYAPVASFRRGEGDEVELWITNDTLAPIADVATLALSQLRGDDDWRTDVRFDVGPNESAIVWRGEVEHGNDRILTVRSPSRLFPGNRLLLGAIKDLALAPNAGLEWTVDGSSITVTAARYALAVRIATSDSAVRFDDNYFDLAAGESRTIVASEALDESTIEISSWAERHLLDGKDPTARATAS